MIGLGVSLVGESSSSGASISARSGGSLLLDDYSGAAAAYSVRKLNSGYSGNCMRVRRASDDSEMDISFDGNGLVDTSSIASHCGSSDGFVVRWYGQDADGKGNGLNATQSTSSSQPKIYDGTSQAVLTENGKPILTGGQLNYSSNITYSNNLHSTFYVCWYSANAVYASSYNGGITGHYAARHRNNLLFESIGGVTTYHQISSLPAYSTQQLISVIDDATNVVTVVNGTSSSASSVSFTSGITTLTHRGEYGLNANVKIQELVVYLSDKSSDRTDIESNIDNYFSIT